MYSKEIYLLEVQEEGSSNNIIAASLSLDSIENLKSSLDPEDYFSPTFNILKKYITISKEWVSWSEDCIKNNLKVSVWCEVLNVNEDNCYITYSDCYTKIEDEHQLIGLFKGELGEYYEKINYIL